MEPKPAGRAEKVEKDGMTGKGKMVEKTREKRAGWMVIKLCDELTYGVSAPSLPYVQLLNPLVFCRVTVSSVSWDPPNSTTLCFPLYQTLQWEWWRWKQGQGEGLNSGE